MPNCFADVIALVALFRPGPLESGMVDDFVDRKHGRTQVVFPHPELEPVLADTYGVILYQEQVMKIAQVLGNYTLGAADIYVGGNYSYTQGIALVNQSNNFICILHFSG